MVAGVIVMLEEGVDLPFDIAGHVVVVEQNAVLKDLMPACRVFTLSKVNLTTRATSSLRPSAETAGKAQEQGHTLQTSALAAIPRQPHGWPAWPAPPMQH